MKALLGPIEVVSGSLTLSGKEYTVDTGSPAKKVDVPIAVKQTAKEINVPLDPEEKMQMGIAMGNMLQQIAFLKAELRKSLSSQREHINSLNGALNEHGKTMANGYRKEIVTVEEQYDFNTDTIRTIYKGKILSERPMTDEEKQLDLELCMQMGYELKAPKSPTMKVVAPHGGGAGTSL